MINRSDGAINAGFNNGSSLINIPGEGKGKILAMTRDNVGRILLVGCKIDGIDKHFFIARIWP